MSVWTGDSEASQIWSEVTRTSRKERKCTACGETIERGHKYVRVTSLYDARWQNVAVRCWRCELIYRHLQSIMPSDEEPEPNLDCGHTYERKWKRSPPEHIARLAFLTPDEAQRELMEQ